MRITKDRGDFRVPYSHLGEHPGRSVNAKHPKRGRQPGREATGAAPNIEKAAGARERRRQLAQQRALGGFDPLAARRVVPRVVAGGGLVEEVPGHAGQRSMEHALETVTVITT